MKKILVTGAAGYIGSVLVRQLLDKGYSVRGVDALYFGGESLLSVYNHAQFEFIKADLRYAHTLPGILDSVTDIVHLAAIVGDPACAKQPELASEINWVATKNLFDLASSKPGVNHFVFASTCSNYGKMDGDGFVSEESPLNPVSLYAELKVKFERYLLEYEGRKDFIPTALRFSTVYGLSPRMRFDLTVNEFVREVATGKELEVFGEQFWRPYCHVEDLAAACVKVIESDPILVRNNVFNVGDTNENYQKKMIVDEITKVIPGLKVRYIHKTEDPRDYRVDFTKINKELGFKISKTLLDGVRELNDVIANGLITDPYSSTYKNI